jgi:sugar O-acyltransferase (sialic acid O-acetyltransferase NeuD family)
MVQDIIIMGVGGTGREVAEVIEDINSLGRKWNLLGFLDDDPQKLGTEYNGYPVLGPIGTATQYPTCQFVVVLGSPRDLPLTKRVVERLALDGSKFATIVHPSAQVSRYADLAPGTIVMQNCIITTNAKIGRHVLVMFGSSIAHDCVVDDYVIIAPHSALAGYVCIGEGCYIGTNASIIQKVKIGPWSCVGMGAAVFSDVPPHTTVMGNPARSLRRHKAVVEAAEGDAG